jgi:membrane protease YdiL (CAAX protease family)
MTTHAEPPPTETPVPAPAEIATPEATPARWRPPVAAAVVIAGLVVGQLAALAVILVAGDTDRVMAAGFVLADLLLVGIIVGSASRGAERLSAATLGVRRTRFWRAVGWTLAIWVGVLAIEALWAALVGGFSNVEEDPGITEGELIMILFAVAVVTPIAEELAFRGYLFPALTRWRGPWIGAVLTALLFGAAHVVSSPVEALPALAVFGFGACLLFWFTGSLLPCVALHAGNNALVMSIGGDWTWQVPVAMVACVTLSVLLLLPFAREREPYAAE